MKKRDDDRVRRVLAKLEARKARRGQADEPAVFVCPSDELPDEYVARLRAEGRITRPVLCVPATPKSPEEIAVWADSCSRYQRWLLSHAAGRDSPDPDRIREAYRASLTDAPMPD